MSLTIDRESLLVRVPGAVTIAQVEDTLRAEGLTLDMSVEDTSISIADWLAQGAPGAPSVFADPADHLIAGMTVTLVNGRHLEVHPCPRRAVGPDLVALVLGAGERFATVDRAWLRVQLIGTKRRFEPTTHLELDAPVSKEEALLLDAIEQELALTR